MHTCNNYCSIVFRSRDPCAGKDWAPIGAQPALNGYRRAIFFIFRSGQVRDATAAAEDLCAARFEAFGCAGQAARIRPVALEQMAGRYREASAGYKCAA